MTTLDWVLLVLNPLTWGVVGFCVGWTMQTGRWPWQR